MENWITADSFGSECPANWEEIADFLNEIIRKRGIENDHNEVNELWDAFWAGRIPGAQELIDNAGR